MKSLSIRYLKDPDTYPLVQAAVDPKHKDIVLNGYGVTKKQAKKLRDWLTKAIKEIK